MKNILLLIFIGFNYIGLSQNYASKDFYLIDSLDLNTLSEENVRIIDSCLTIYHKTNSDSIKWEVLNKIIENTYNEIWIEYQYISNEITNKNLSKNKSNYLLNQKSSNLNNMAYWYKAKGNLKKALQLYKESLTLSKKTNNLELLSIQLNNIAGVYYKTGKISEALKYYEQSITVAKQSKHKNLAQITANVAMVYKNLDQPKEALKLLKEALSIQRNNNNKSQEALILSDLGSIYSSNMEDYDKAIDYHNQSLKLNLEIGFKRKIATNYEHISTCYQKKGDTVRGLNYIRKSKVLYQEINSKEGISSANQMLANIFLNQGKIDSAIILSEISLKIAQEIGSPAKIKKSSNTLYRVYAKKHRYKEAYDAYRLYVKMSDSLQNNENIKSLAQTEARLGFEKEKEISSLKHEQEIALEEKEKEKQTFYKRIALTGSLGLAIILFLIIIQLKKSIHQKKVIETSKLKLEEKNKEITDSIIYTKRIQTAILPQQKELDEFLPHSFVYYLPKDIISGDFYWLESIQDTIYFAVADCTGHGVPGAMVSIICNNGLNKSIREHKIVSTNKILDKTRDLVIEEFAKSGDNIQDGMDISLISLDLKHAQLNFSGAQNSAWIFRKKDNFTSLDNEFKTSEFNDFTIIELKGDKQPIGKYDNSVPFTSKSIKIKKNDTIYLFSDGIIDQFGGSKNKKLKIKNFREFLATIQDEPIKTHQKIINTYFTEWKGDNEQIDDVCVAGIRI